jgi:sarcosine oxidase subunit alpha
VKQTRVQVAVVGGGPAGLAAAMAAARAGAATRLIDEWPVPGGQLRYRCQAVDDGSGAMVPPAVLAARLIDDARAAGVELVSGQVVWSLFDERRLGVVGTGGQAVAEVVAADAVILATGSIDRSLVFAGASLPGVFTARAVQLLLHVYRVWPGRRFVVVGDGEEAAEIAGDIRLAGGEIVAEVSASRSMAAAGSGGIDSVIIDGEPLAADVVVVAAGRRPDAMLAQMAGCAMVYDPAVGDLVPMRDDRLRTTVPGLIVAGDAAGPGDVALALAEGRLAGLAAAAEVGLVEDEAFAAALEPFGRDVPARPATLGPAHVQAYR